MPLTSKLRRSEVTMSLRSVNGRRKCMPQRRQSARSLQSAKTCWCATWTSGHINRACTDHTESFDLAAADGRSPWLAMWQRRI